MELLHKKNVCRLSVYKLIVFAMFMLFFTNREFFFSSDYSLHAEVALSMHKVFTTGYDSFVESTKYSQLLLYPVWHVLYLSIYLLINQVSKIALVEGISTEQSMVIANAILNSIILTFTFEIVFWAVGKRTDNQYSCTVLNETLALLFVGPIYIYCICPTYYLGQFTPNPWHNPTTLIVKPIAVLTFYSFIRLYEEKKGQVVEFIKFCLLLAFSLFIKPSFFQTFIPGLIVFCIIDCIKTRGRSFKFNLDVAIAVIPSGLIMLIQSAVSLNNIKNSVVWMPFYVWRLYSNNLVFSLILSVAFPVVVTVIYILHKEWCNSLFLAWCVFGSGLLQFMLLGFEKGTSAGDFLWGVYVALFILFIEAVNSLRRYYSKHNINNEYRIAWSLFILHTICGAGYFIAIWVRHSYLL